MRDVEQQPSTDFCPRYHKAAEIIGRRWNGVILRVMLRGPVRFRDVIAAIPDLSDRMLSERLKALEAEHILTRNVVPATPVRIEYALTPKGKALGPVVEALSAWAEEWIEVPSGKLEAAEPTRPPQP